MKETPQNKVGSVNIDEVIENGKKRHYNIVITRRILTNVTRFFEGCFIHSWWVIFFFLLCYLLFEQAQPQREADFKELSIQLHTLKLEKEIATDLQKKLLMQINCQSDPEWIELTLRKGLGVVPEGQIKIYFSDDYGIK